MSDFKENGQNERTRVGLKNVYVQLPKRRIYRKCAEFKDNVSYFEWKYVGLSKKILSESDKMYQQSNEMCQKSKNLWNFEEV